MSLQFPIQQRAIHSNPEKGAVSGAKMSNKDSFPSRSNGGYTSHPVPRGYAYSTSTSKGITGAKSHLMSSSSGPSFRSNIPPVLQSRKGNYAGAKTSHKVCFPSESQGISNPENGLTGAVMSTSYRERSVASSYPESGLIGAVMSTSYRGRAAPSSYPESGLIGE